MSTQQELPTELRSLVRFLSTLLGQVILEREGSELYSEIENLRSRMKKLRDSKQSAQILSHLLQGLRQKTQSEQYKIAHSFALLLELINMAEGAFRTWKLRKKHASIHEDVQREMIYVVTAHPTESRSPQMLCMSRSLRELLILSLETQIELHHKDIKTLIGMMWSIPLSKNQSPRVIDEAESLFEVIIREPVFDELLFHPNGVKINLRTWVGGDKDGHPGVDAAVMLASLNLSRQRFCAMQAQHYKELLIDLSKLRVAEHTRAVSAGVYNKLDVMLADLLKNLKGISKLSSGDRLRLQNFYKKHTKFAELWNKNFSYHKRIDFLNRLYKRTPALVIPLELRESAEQIQEALKSASKTPLPIVKMLQALSSLAKDRELLHYARGLIISHCESSADWVRTLQLVKKHLKTQTFPVIPLFETRSAMESASKICSEIITDHGDLIRSKWRAHFEVMLGYSDSSKEMGALPSRYLIRNTMFELDQLFAKTQITPVFFHGTGGSVDRGGGSVQEQVSWWAPSAQALPKLTLQGEMVQRSFATPEIMRSQSSHFVNVGTKAHKKSKIPHTNKALEAFVAQVESCYRAFVGDAQKLQLALKATPYEALDKLKIGSRPSKRPAAQVDLTSLRAIPWVLCWTQSRILFPVWWGVGRAWSEASLEHRSELKELFKQDPLLSSFVKVLGFTLAKVELDIWELYLKQRLTGNVISTQDLQELAQEFRQEYTLACEFVTELSGEKNLLWYRPWLQESIQARSPLIHPLNLTLLVALENQDQLLFRESVSGIACGMMTTG